MKHQYLNNFFDIFFRILLVFLLSFVWIRYFIQNLAICVILTIFCTIIIESIIFFIKKRKNIKQNISKKQQKEIENMTNYFTFSTPKSTLEFFLMLAKTKHVAVKKGKYILICENDKKVVLFPQFLVDNLNSQHIANIYSLAKKENPNRIVICTKGVDNSASSLSKKLPIKFVILNCEQTYFELVKKYDVSVPQIELLVQNKNTLKDFIQIALNRKRTKGYFYCALLFIFYSFFTTFKIYYLVMSTLLLVLSFASFSNTKFNTTNPKEIL